MSLNNKNNSCCDNVQSLVESLTNELGVSNCKLNIVPGTVRGDNYFGVISKVTVSGEDKAGKKTTLNLIAKSAPTNENFRSTVPIRNAYAREIYMYSKVFPEFKRLQEERGVLKPLKCFAKLHKATMKDGNEVLIMEDMKELGYRMQDRREPLDYNHVRLVLREYGRYHALSYALRDQKPALFQELINNTQENFFAFFGNTEMAHKEIEINTRRALDALDPIKHKEAYEKFEKFLEKVYSSIQHVLKCDVAGKYAVIGHGDCWMNNMLFKYGDFSTDSLPSTLCFLDWQLARAGSPALDLSYFIFTCTDGKLRAQHYDALIREYYSSLSSFLRELGSDPDKLFPFDVLQEHLKKFGVFGLHMSIIVVYLMTSDAEDIPDVHDVADEECALSKWHYTSRNLDKFYDRIRDVVLDYINYGYEL